MRAAMVACSVAGTLTSALSAVDDVCARLPAQHAALGQFAHDLLERRTDFRRPCRRSSGPDCANRWVRPSSSSSSAAVSESLSGARAMVCAPCYPRQRSLILGAVGDQHQRGRLRNHGEELGQHRLADLIDPVRILNDVEPPARCGPTRRRSPARSTAADAHPDRSRAAPRPDRAMPSRSSKQHHILGVCVGNLCAHPCARGLQRQDRSTPVAARSSRATSMERNLTGMRLAEGRKHLDAATFRQRHRSRTSRLLPMPGGPATPTTAPWPSTARSNKPSTVDSSHVASHQSRLRWTRRLVIHSRHPGGDAPSPARRCP